MTHFLTDDVLSDLRCHITFYFTNLLVCQLLEMREVETKNRRRNIRPLLFYVTTQYFTQAFVQQVRCSMVALCCSTVLQIDTGYKCSCQILRKLIRQMYCQIIFTLSIRYFDCFVIGCKPTTITYLSSHFCIEWSATQYNLIELAILLFYLTVTQYFGFTFSEVITYKLWITVFQCHPVFCFYCCGIAGTVFLFLHLCLKAGFIYRHVILFQNQLCKVERKSICII